MNKTIIASALLLSLGVVGCQHSSSDKSSQVKPDVQTASIASAVNHSWTQAALNEFAQKLDVTYRMVSNVPDEACSEAQKDQRCFIAEIDFTSTDNINDTNWLIFYSQMRPVQDVLTPEFAITRVQGDLHQISPTDQFTGFKAGETKTLGFRGELWQLSETDPMPNYYIVVEGLTPAIITSTQVSIDAETGMEQRPYVEAFTDAKRQYRRTDKDQLVWAKAEVLFETNQQVSLNNQVIDNRIIPTPASVNVTSTDKPVDLAQGINVLYNQVKPSSVAAALNRLSRLGVNASDSGIKLSLNTVNDINVPESYQLAVAKDEIVISASDEAGFSYGIASISALITPDDLSLNTLEIKDSPRYDFRGMHVDVARNFHSKQMILDLIDQMAAYKLNKLHLHMADDEGWRLEIDGLPELTDIGSKRCHDLTETTCLIPQLGSGPFADSKVNGFYSKADYIEILQYATARQVEVIPSMDMPGHSRAAIKSMEARYRKLMAAGNEAAANEYLLSDANDKTVYSSVQYYSDNTLNVCMESTFHFVDKVISEIAKLHQQANHPLHRYHIGADETAGAWKQSPQCLTFVANNDKGVTSVDDLGAYFIERLSNSLAAKGIEPAGWSDGMSHTNPANMPAKSQSNIWDVISHDGYRLAHKQANLGWDAVLSTPEVLYFDFPYEADPKEHGYYWAGRAQNSQKIFNFMPDNLPANAEQWQDIEGNPFTADDTVKKDETGKVISGPLQQGKGFSGIQGQLWSETVRSDDVAEYMIYPRVLMLAEKAWHQADWEVPYQYSGAVYDANSGFFTAELREKQQQQWNELANTLGQKEFAKLDKANIAYRLPTVGAKVINGKLHTNIAFPGLQIEYRDQRGIWTLFKQPVEVTGEVEVRTISPDGNRKGRSLSLSNR
ncbi:beta-N-acetylhexosaminidase [Shewanella sp. 10N.286.51.B7]|uniref:family 20 glycosylhydrolase n=1 Tax=Shewanella sp. 10N.286.51.B7 TaxID=1880836 RepID=UPI000C8193DD|nr:family 20 glycosylhydrolase [Shewanella sp. 10N.286.51.B7]PMG75724.1 beta-N-acetylhexosaminidase [Shewanella sp. 10N.286.51.B7]